MIKWINKIFGKVKQCRLTVKTYFLFLFYVTTDTNMPRFLTSLESESGSVVSDCV